jgi:hypothetical protein
MLKIEVRPARPEDRPAIERLGFTVLREEVAAWVESTAGRPLSEAYMERPASVSDQAAG